MTATSIEGEIGGRLFIIYCERVQGTCYRNYWNDAASRNDHHCHYSSRLIAIVQKDESSHQRVAAANNYPVILVGGWRPSATV